MHPRGWSPLGRTLPASALALLQVRTLSVTRYECLYGWYREGVEASMVDSIGVLTGTGGLRASFIIRREPL